MTLSSGVSSTNSLSLYGAEGQSWTLWVLDTHSTNWATSLGPNIIFNKITSIEKRVENESGEEFRRHIFRNLYRYIVCLLLSVPVAVANYLDKAAQGKACSSFHFRNLKQLVTWLQTVGREQWTRQQLVGLLLSTSVSAVQDPSPGKWSHSQWPGFPTSINAIKIIPLRNAQSPSRPC